MTSEEIAMVLIALSIICFLLACSKTGKRQRRRKQPYVRGTIYKELLQEIQQPTIVERPSTDSTTYDQLLQDERWRIRRQEIIDRDHSTCCFCKKYTSHPQVHHKWYVCIHGHYRKPWDYPDKALITLCPRCHEWWHSKHKNKVYYH